MSDERRAAHRYETPTEKHPAILRLMEKDHSVGIINESATGFLFEADGNPLAESEDTVKLHAAGSWCEVKVVHLASRDEKTRVGVKRIRDLTDGDASRPREPSSWELRLSHLLSQVRRHKAPAGLVVVGLTLGLLCAVVCDRSGESNAAAWLGADAIADGEDGDALPPSVASRRERVLASKLCALRNLAWAPGHPTAVELTDRQRSEIQRIIQPVLPSLADESLPLPARERITERLCARVVVYLTAQQRKRLFPHSNTIPPELRQRYYGPTRPSLGMDRIFEVSLSTSAARRDDVLAAKMRVLSNLVCSPDIAEKLQLTPQQRTTIRGVVQPRMRLTADESRSLQHRNDMADRATAEILACMTVEQQKKFLALRLGKEGPRLSATRIRALDSLANSPDIAARLVLAADRREAIRRIVEPILPTLADDAMSLRRRESLLDRAYADVLAELTPAQQEQFLGMKFQ